MEAYETINGRGATVEIYQDVDAGNPFEEYDELGTLEEIDDHYCESTEEQIRRRRLEGETIIPMYLEEHGGQARAYESTPDHCNRVLTVDRSRLIAEYGDVSARSRRVARRCLRSELETFNQYLEGDVWGYVAESADGAFEDSCWGFYGLEYAREEAREALAHVEEQVAAEELERAAMAARDVATV